MERAPAAELATRKFKPKPMRRKTPLRSDPNLAQFAPNASQGGGGLFGGSVQAPGTFDFSAPAGGISFPPSSFSGTNMSFGMNSASSPDVSENEAEGRADSTGEEAARRSKPFRGADSQVQGNNVPFQMSNPFAQNQQPNPFSTANSQEKSSSIFSFGQSTPPTQPATSGLNFNSTPAQDKPVGNNFSFGTTSSQTAPRGGFGSGQTQEKPVNNIFSFGQSATQPGKASNPVFNFGSPASQDKPETSPFSFGQSSKEPSTSGINFGASPAIENPAANIFGGSQPQQQPPPSTNLFGSLGQQSTPSTNIFGNLNAPGSIASNPFGSRQEQTTASKANGIFSERSQQPAQNTNSFFSNSTPTPSTPNIFGGQKQQTASASNMFGSVNTGQVSASNLFSSSTQPAPSTSSVFSKADNQTTPAANLFGNLNKPIDQSVAQSKPDENLTNGTGTNNTSSLFDKSTPLDQTQDPPTNLFGGSKPLVSEQPSQAEQASNSNSISLFGPRQPSTLGNNGNNLFLPLKPISAPISASQPPPSGMFPSLVQETQSPPKSDVVSTKAAAQALSGSSNNFINGSEIEKVDKNVLYPDMAAASAISDQFIAPLVPATFTDEQRKEFYAGYRIRSLNKAMQNFFGTIPLGLEINNALAFYNEKREEILARSCVPLNGSKRKTMDNDGQKNENASKRAKQSQVSGAGQLQSERGLAAVSPEKPIGNQSQPYINGSTTPKAPLFTTSQSFLPDVAPPASASPRGKRKAESQMTKEGDEEEAAREKRRYIMPSTNGTAGGSNTSNIFKNILDSPSSDVPGTRKSLPQPETSKGEAPRFNSVENFPSPATGGKPTASTSLSAPATSLFASKTSSDIPPSLFSPKPTPSTPTSMFKPAEQKNNVVKPPSFGSGPVNFLAQFGQQASKYKQDNEQKLMEDAKAEDMDSDEDEVEWEAKYKEKRRTDLKAIDDLAKSKRATFVAGKGFTFGQTEETTDNASQPVSNSSQEKTTPLISAAKAADIAPSSTPNFPLFGQIPSAGNSHFSSGNPSRTSTPGLFTSAAGSVLDDHTPGKPVSFGGNIFAHLSDADSGADSGKGNDADDESADEDTDPDGDSENKDPTYEPEVETGSGHGTPVEETGLGIIASAKKATAALAFESPIKPGKFGSSNSGTSSPGGSLFDRISKDSNGNPIRKIPTEEKENTQPSTMTSIFSSSFNKTPGVAADKTWKPDSPIRFGSATPNNGAGADSAPTVNVTEATPPRPANPFAGLFGNSTNSKPAPSFTLGGASTGVGFGFGGPSSAASSLFPSAAASTTTSRATSPGATTDGDSTAEADADGEQHEQIDLTKGDPNEKEEEALHEVRAKALKFSPKEEGDKSNPWETKGVGPLRVLRNKESKVSRILLRADPSGTIVLNKAILPQVNYEATGKTIKLLTSGDGGNGLETWILQVKSPELAELLAAALESAKSS